MQSRKEQVIKGAIVGGVTGFVVSGVVGYSISGEAGLCSLLPNYYAKTMAQSFAQLNKTVTAVTIQKTDLLKQSLYHAANNVGSDFQYGSHINTAQNTIKFVANKIPLVAETLPIIGSFVEKSFSNSNPILKNLTYTVLEITTDAIKTGLVVACVETMSQYNVIPLVCLTGTLLGAGFGAWIGFMGPPQPKQENLITKESRNRADIKKSLLESQSLFSKNIKNMSRTKLQERRDKFIENRVFGNHVF